MAKTRGKNPSSPVLRVRELYAFDEQIRLGGGVSPESATPPPESVASGLVPDVEGLVPNGNGIGVCSVGLHARRSRTSQERCDATKTMEIAGFDEAGRGALAGPVVVGCVHIPVASGFMPDVKGLVSDGGNCSVGPCARRGTSILDFLAGIDDSKRVSSKRREALFPRITSVSDWGIGCAAPSEIDRVGIVPALTLAACRAYRAMRHPVDLLLLDRGLSLRERRTQGTTLRPSVASGFTPDVEDCSVGLHARRSRTTAELAFTKGDSRSLHIAAASILAKVHRDRMMVKLNAQYPGYGLDRNKGYGTPVHLAALKRLGPSSIHRRSFRLH